MKIRAKLLKGAISLLLGVSLFTTTLTSFGQLSAQENLVSMRAARYSSFPAAYQEERSEIESWMLQPFIMDLGEEELFLESWMKVLFINQAEEEAPSVEAWMILPFEPEEKVELEEWMASSWI